MLASTTHGSTAYRHQFSMSNTASKLNLSSLFSSDNSKTNSTSDFAKLFSSADSEAILSRLYEQMTGQTKASGDGANWFLPVLSANSGKVDMTRLFNEDSKGDHVMTAEDIAMLKSKYDINDLSAQDRYDLFCDLTDMGVLTPDDARSVGRMVTVETTIIHLSYTAVYIDAPVKNGETLLQQLIAILGKEEKDYDLILDLSQKPDGARYRVSASKFEASIEQHKKVFNVLEQISV